MGSLAPLVLHTHLALIEVSDPLLLTELKADGKIGSLILGQLSDRIAIVAASEAERLIQRLVKAGHLPRVVRGGGGGG